jgi:hypothetical protein
MQSDDFFFKALTEGEVSISVQILERGYESVNAAHYKLSIVSPFIVQPRKNFLSKHEDSQAIVESIRDDGIIRILPNSYFEFKLSQVMQSPD